MGKQKSLFYQFQSCCQFVPHYDKHSSKKQDHDNSHVIKSLSSKSNILDFAKQFTTYIKENFPQVKKISQITQPMVQSFIDKKCSEGCTEKTIKGYQSLLHKLEVCAKHTFHVNIDFRTEINVGLLQDRVSIKEFAFTNDEMKKILDYKGRSKCIEVVRFNSFAGCRINSCEKILVRDIRIVGNDVHITIRNDKGGRFRTITIENNKEFVQLCKELRSGKNPNDRLFNVKADSVNKFIRRRASALGIRTPDGQVKSGNHSIRKNVATNMYKNNGGNIGSVMTFLGHSREREDLREAYIKDGV